MGFGLPLDAIGVIALVNAAQALMESEFYYRLVQIAGKVLICFYARLVLMDHKDFKRCFLAEVEAMRKSQWLNGLHVLISAIGGLVAGRFC